MSRIIGWAVLILLARTLAVAWLGPSIDEASPTLAPDASPADIHVQANVADLPLTLIDDRSLVFLSP